MGDATKCERCGYIMHATDGAHDCCDSGGIACLERVVAHLTAEVATLNAAIDRMNAETGRRLDEAHEAVDRAEAEVATLRAELDDADARWRAAELFATPTCGAFDGVMHCDATAEWSPADRDHRCTEHTTREGTEVVTP